MAYGIFHGLSLAGDVVQPSVGREHPFAFGIQEVEVVLGIETRTGINLVPGINATAGNGHHTAGVNVQERPASGVPFVECGNQRPSQSHFSLAVGSTLTYVGCAALVAEGNGLVGCDVQYLPTVYVAPQIRGVDGNLPDLPDACKLAAVGTLCAETAFAIDVNLLETQPVTRHFGDAHPPKAFLNGGEPCGLHAARNGGALVRLRSAELNGFAQRGVYFERLVLGVVPSREIDHKTVNRSVSLKRYGTRNGSLQRLERLGCGAVVGIAARWRHIQLVYGTSGDDALQKRHRQR